MLSTHAMQLSTRVKHEIEVFTNKNIANVNAETREHFAELLCEKHNNVVDVIDCVAVLVYKNDEGKYVAYYDEELELGYIS